MVVVWKAVFWGVLVHGLSGCVWVDLKPQGEKVRFLSAQEVGRCKYLGRVTSNTTSKVLGFIARGRSFVHEEVQHLARNNAADMGGDTLVEVSPLIEGEQSFDVYRCINP